MINDFFASKFQMIKTPTIKAVNLVCEILNDF